jgi:hypothetical protein
MRRNWIGPVGEMVVAAGVATGVAAGVWAFYQRASQDIAEPSPLVEAIAGGASLLVIGGIVTTFALQKLHTLRISDQDRRLEQIAATHKKAKDEEQSKRAKAASRRASCAALAAKTSSVDLRAALTDFIAANKRWADGRASGSYGDNPRLRHAIEIVESACLRVLSDTSLMSSEEAHLRLVEPLRRATGQLNAEMSAAVTAKLEDMSLDLDLAQRVFEGAPQ